MTDSCTVQSQDDAQTYHINDETEMTTQVTECHDAKPPNILLVCGT
jgi:hypothetical protein